MEYITGTDDIHMKQECVVTFGKSDGVHRGHQKLISRVKKYARKRVMHLSCFRLMYRR